MGNSTSRNVTSLTTNSLSQSTNSFLQDISSDALVEQSINITDTIGNVVVSGNTQKATVDISMTGIQKLLSTQEAQLKLASDLAQNSKALTDGVSLLAFSSAENIVDQYINTTIKLASNIAQTCATSGITKQEINVTNTGEDVFVIGNSQESLTTMYTKCLSDSIANSSTLQDIQATIDQSAEATTKGADLVLLALLALLALAAPFIIPIIGAGVGFNSLMKIIFPIIMFVGFAFLIIWWRNTNKEIISYGFSNLIGDTSDCIATEYDNTTDIKSAPEAAATCESDEQCEGYDFQSYTINNDNNAVLLDGGPKTTFFKDFRKSPCKYITDNSDDVRIMVPRKVYSQENRPTVNVSTGDVWLRKTSGFDGDVQYSIKTEGDWESFYDWGVDTSKEIPDDGIAPRLNLLDNRAIAYDSLSSDSNPGTSFVSFLYVIKMSSLGYFNLYTRNGSSWGKTKLLIPGLNPSVPKNDDGTVASNYSGFAEEKKDPIWLYIGVVCIILGVVGTVVTFIPKSKKKPSAVPST